MVQLSHLKLQKCSSHIQTTENGIFGPLKL